MHKDLIEKYLLNAEEKLSVAEYLLKGKFYKDSISRSYYSMFFAAKALLATKEIYPESHRGVVLQFGLQFVKDGFIKEMYGRAFRIAKEQRESVDYGIDIVVHCTEAEGNFKKAAEFLKVVKKVIEKLQKEEKQ